MAAKAPKLLVLQDSNLRALLHDPRVTQIVPCLDGAARNLAKRKAKCGRCKRKQRDAGNKALSEIKQCLAAMPAEKRTQLKQVLGTQSIRFYKRNARGGQVKVTL